MAAPCLYEEREAAVGSTDGSALGCRDCYKTMSDNAESVLQARKGDRGRLFCGGFFLTGAVSVPPMQTGSFRGSQVDRHSGLKILDSTYTILRNQPTNQQQHKQTNPSVLEHSHFAPLTLGHLLLILCLGVSIPNSTVHNPKLLPVSSQCAKVCRLLAWLDFRATSEQLH